MVRTLCLKVTGDIPYCLVEHHGRLGRLVQTGLLADGKPLDWRKLDRVFCEVNDVRSLYDDAFVQMDDAAVKDALSDLFGKNSETGFVLSRLSNGYVATLRESQYQAVLERVNGNSVVPSLVCPENIGLFCALREKRGDGFYRLNCGTDVILFIIEDKALKFQVKDAPGMDVAIKQRFGIVDNPIDIGLSDLGLAGTETPSLMGLALYSKAESEPSNFLYNLLKEKALEPARMRRSLTIGGALSAVVLLITLGIGLWGHGLGSAYTQSELRYNVDKKRYDKVLVLQNEAIGLFKDLIKLSGATAGGGSITRSLLCITQTAPASITLTAIDQEKRVGGGAGFVISGIAQDMATVFEYEAALKKGQYKNSKVSDTRKITGNNAETVMFRINVNE